MAMATGRVKWFNSKKGFGFIGQGEGQPDIFVHFSQIEMDGYRELKQGQEVEFEVSQGEKGPMAVGVKAI